MLRHRKAVVAGILGLCIVALVTSRHHSPGHDISTDTAAAAATTTPPAPTTHLPTASADTPASSGGAGGSPSGVRAAGGGGSRGSAQFGSTKEELAALKQHIVGTLNAKRTEIPRVKGGGGGIEGAAWFDSASCLGYLEVHQESCDSAWMSRTQLSENASWDAFLHTTGLDYLRATVEGDAELFTANVTAIEPCSYAAGFRLLCKQGKVMLHLKWETDNFNGVTETLGTITSFRDKHVARFLTLGSCGRAAETAHPPDLLQFRNTLDMSGSRYYHSEGHAALYPFVDGPKGLQWRWLRNPEVVWAGAGSRSDSEIQREVLKGRAPCDGEGSKGMRVMFMGESHLRTVWRHWESVLRRKNPVRLKTSGERHAFGVHQVVFEFNPLMKALSVADFQRYDAVFLGFGAWPANTGWTHAQYFQFIDEIFELMAGLKNIVWLGTPAWPKPRHNSGGFRITNARLKLWNAYSARQARAHGFDVVDFFTASAPLMSLHHPDAMHYDNSVILLSMVEEVARRTCIPWKSPGGG